MTEETKDAEREAAVQGNEETGIDWKAVNEELQGIVAKVRQEFESEVAARSVPAGAPPRTMPDMSALPPGEKIAQALTRQRP
jgi:hypothetical protein